MSKLINNRHILALCLLLGVQSVATFGLLGRPHFGFGFGGMHDPFKMMDEMMMPRARPVYHRPMYHRAAPLISHLGFDSDFDILDDFPAFGLPTRRARPSPIGLSIGDLLAQHHRALNPGPSPLGALDEFERTLLAAARPRAPAASLKDSGPLPEPEQKPFELPSWTRSARNTAGRRPAQKMPVVTSATSEVDPLTGRSVPRTTPVHSDAPVESGVALPKPTGLESSAVEEARAVNHEPAPEPKIEKAPETEPASPEEPVEAVQIPIRIVAPPEVEQVPEPVREKPIPEPTAEPTKIPVKEPPTSAPVVSEPEPVPEPVAKDDENEAEFMITEAEGEGEGERWRYHYFDQDDVFEKLGDNDLILPRMKHAKPAGRGM